VAKQIAALSQATRKRLEKVPIASGTTCAVVAPVEQKRITKLVFAWIEAQHPDEGSAFAPMDKAYLAALRTLGAPDSLVGEAKVQLAKSAP
jgi:hypothetical protein